MIAKKCPTCDAELSQPSRFCPACGSSLDPKALSEARTLLTGSVAGPAAGSQSAMGAPSAAWLSSSSSLDTARFAVGTVLVDRYRIIGLLGRGGMGEVYRADDLKLGQPVALKFLPPELASNPDRLARFYSEVRIARQVSHPNVCRVYDIGELEGTPFLSMEYVDGEDLASLLRRIGRLPGDKGVEVARQLCAGLAAAHDRGVLHRDLKPGNVMIDSQGKARITDFGLAVLAEQGDVAGARAGTPAYMAPEQLAAGRTSVQSDVYSLGVLLYEMFTGRRPFVAETLPEMRRLHEESQPSSPSAVIEGIDPVLERAVLRCLEKSPAERPPSALAVAASLPGGDPLAAALAAGEMPSPEMVAAAGAARGISGALAWGALAAVVLLVGAILAVTRASSLLERVPLEKPPAVLVDRATEILRQSGYAEPAADRAFGFEQDNDYLRHVERHDLSRTRWNALRSGRPTALCFWYRQSPRYMRKLGSLQGPAVGLDDPPLVRSGMATVVLDPSGRLLRLDVVPPQVDSTRSAATGPNWPALFAAAGLDTARFAPAEPRWVPGAYCDQRVAWQGSYPGRTDIPLRVEAGAYAGRPVYFQLIAPWTRPERMQPVQERLGQRAGQALATGLIVSLLLGGALLAYRNLKLHRGDRRGATRIAAFVTMMSLIGWFLEANHAPTLPEEWAMAIPFLASSAFVGAIVWVLYIALEPFVRRRWPDSLIAWSRLLAGRFRDPLVGRDLLVGVLAGLLLQLLGSLGNLVPGWLGSSPTAPEGPDLFTLHGGVRVVSRLVVLMADAPIVPMLVLFLMFLARTLLRRQWIAAAVVVAIFSLLPAIASEHFFVTLGIALPLVAIWVTVLLRFGLFAAIVMLFTGNVLGSYPITTNRSAWFGPLSAFALGVILAMAVYGFYASRSRRPLFDAAAQRGRA